MNLLVFWVLTALKLQNINFFMEAHFSWMTSYFNGALKIAEKYKDDMKKMKMKQFILWFFYTKYGFSLF